MNKCTNDDEKSKITTLDEMRLPFHPIKKDDDNTRFHKRHLLNIEDVEQEIILSPQISFGLGPTDAQFFKHHQRPIVLVNLRKAETIWYMEKKLIPSNWTYLHFPMETRNARDGDEEEYLLGEQETDNQVLAVAEKLLNILKTTNTKLFIHAYESNKAACIVALLVWYLHKGSSFDPIQKLHTDIFKNDQELTKDFPQNKQHIELLKRIQEKRKKSINYFFENTNKKQKK
jgi:hypothetical protein